MADVFVIDLDGAISSAALDDAERERATLLSDPVDRSRYVAAHTALRQLLGEATGRDPAGVRVLRAPCAACGGPHGKPFTPSGPHFSLSRSGRWALVATDDGPVGVDVEEPQDPRRLTALAPQLLAPGETSTDLLRTWVRKEALLKATGEGLTRSMTSFCDDALGVVDLDLPHGLVGAVRFTGASPGSARVRHR